MNIRTRNDAYDDNERNGPVMRGQGDAAQPCRRVDELRRLARHRQPDHSLRSHHTYRSVNHARGTALSHGQNRTLVALCFPSSY